MHAIPESLTHRPFTRAEAIAAGITSRMLQGRRFVRLHPGVHRRVDHVMSRSDEVLAARLALPPGARLTGLTRLQGLGLDFGPRWPLHLVVEGDLHLAVKGVFLHRTVLMPPANDEAVSLAVAYIAYIAYLAGARVIDAIKAGDWLLREKHVTAHEIVELAEEQQWRAGAAEALWILQHLDSDARSLPESEMRVMLSFEGLPRADVNQPVDLTGALPYIADLYYRDQRVAVEYEGAHHQEDREAYGGDIDRYADLRRADVHYVQVTREKQARPRILIGEVYRALFARGYCGPLPRTGRAVASAVPTGLRDARPAAEVSSRRGVRWSGGGWATRGPRARLLRHRPRRGGHEVPKDRGLIGRSCRGPDYSGPVEFLTWRATPNAGSASASTPVARSPTWSRSTARPVRP